MSTCACCPDDHTQRICNLITDEICGIFDICCKKTVWSLDPSMIEKNVQTAATVSICYESGNVSAVHAIVGKTDGTSVTLTADRQNSGSVTLLNIVSLEIVSSPNACRCKGKYSIILHYDACDALQGI